MYVLSETKCIRDTDAGQTEIMTTKGETMHVRMKH
jgi:hypothetical protein